MLRLAAALVFLALPALAAEPRPGDRFRVDPAALPAPNATPSSANPAEVVARPKGATLSVPAGWRASLFAEGLDHPRNVMVLPDGAVLVAEQRVGKLTLLREGSRTTFATGFAEPFGLDFRDGQVWVADTKAVWRLPYPGGQGRERVTEPGALGDDPGHSTRSLAIAPDGKRFYVGIGSRGNIGIEPMPRASIQEFRLDEAGTVVEQHTFAWGLRNPVGMAFRPGTDELWTVVNERDGLGDELVPDYLTRVQPGGFYGWPYSYIGANPQPGLAERAPELVKKAIVPDVLFRSHSAPLGLAFSQGDAYVGLHGSWNRSEPIGYFVARVPFKDGKPAGHYEAFATGFMTGPGKVWGRPVGIAAAPDGTLYVADDAGKTVWKIEKVK